MPELATEAQSQPSLSSPPSPSWYAALTLAERATVIHAQQSERSPVPNERALRQLQRWRDQFGDPALFATRLAQDELTDDELLRVLSTPVEALPQQLREPPAWISAIQQAMTRSEAHYPIPLPELFQGQAFAEFVDLIEPLLGQARDQLRQGVQPLIETATELPFDPRTIDELLLTMLPWKSLVVMLGRTMALELNVARLQGVLTGETPQERFRSFIERLRQRETALSLFHEYPVLIRQINLTLEQWVACGLEFLRHLTDDWAALRTAFSPTGDPGLLSAVEGGLSDSHRRGRSVLIVSFSAGLKIVYKPRSLAVDQHFQELLHWLNTIDQRLPLRTIEVVDRGSYGWTTFVAAQPCGSDEELRRFYERQGRYLALLYLLDATDFYYENLIAAGEHPVLIDLESLFHPRLDSRTASAAGQQDEHPLDQTVLRIGMLPHRVWTDVTQPGLDLSGMGMTAGQILPGVLSWEQPGTDEMRLTLSSMLVREAHHRPTLDGSPADASAYRQEIASGFRAMYALLLEQRAALLAADGPLARFAQDEVRVITRPTVTYITLLRESFHPDLLRDALERDRFFDQLWADVRQFPYMAQLIPAERSDLLHGDIPLFTARPASRTVWSSAQQPLDAMLEQSPLEHVYQRLHTLSQRDLDLQLWCIDTALATLAINQREVPWSRYQLNESAAQRPVTRARLLAAASAVGARLTTLALTDKHTVNWIGLHYEHERGWAIGQLDSDLYDGLAGIALFLAQLGALTGEARFTELAQTGLATIRRRLQQRPMLFGARIGFEGWGGLIATLTLLAELWQDPALLDEAAQLVERLPPLIDKDQAFDIIGGAAGCLAGLLTLERAAPSAAVRGALLQCGERLLAGAQGMEQGIGWVSPVAPRPLAGFAHGAAGIAWAMAELATLTGQQRFADAAREALRYERTLFSPEAGNWYYQEHARDSEHPDGKLLAAWCHGAPGIGLARLYMLRHLDDPTLRSDLAVALQTTLSQGFGGNHSLCHGDLGNLELLLQAREQLDRQTWAPQVEQRAAQILDNIERHGWLCGTPDGLESPGLMTGLAGIGYQLLRLAEPQRVPALLMLAAPAPS